MTIFEYKVAFYDDFKEESRICKGYTMAETFKGAMDNVVIMYGEEAIETVMLNAVAGDHCIELEDCEYSREELYKEWVGPIINTGW